MEDRARRRFDQVWPNGPVVLSVIHVQTVPQALHNAELTRAAGADGLFLIEHRGDEDLLSEAILAVRGEHRDFWVGANYLADPSWLDEVVDPALDGLWVDDALIIEGAPDQRAAAELTARVRAANPDMLYFGGVAFKYGRPVRDVSAVCAAAVPHCDVVCTSGPGTGKAADRSKILEARKGCGSAPLGLASGVTPDNVADYLGLVDAFLVATGVSVDFHRLDQGKLAALTEAVHETRT